MVYDDYMLWLFCVKNMWQKKIEALLTYFQTPENIYKASETILEKSNCIKAKDIAEIMESRKKFDIQKERKKLEDLNIQFITEKSELFPKRLLNISDRPRALFVRGQGIEFLNGPSAAIIGARVCSPYGIYTAQKFSRELACCQVNIISGLARGIDSAAHAVRISVIRRKTRNYMTEYRKRERFCQNIRLRQNRLHGNFHRETGLSADCRTVW